MPEIPDSVNDRNHWIILKDLDENGVGLSQWEIDFVESLMKQLLGGRFISVKQRSRLDEIRVARRE